MESAGWTWITTFKLGSPRALFFRWSHRVAGQIPKARSQACLSTELSVSISFTLPDTRSWANGNLPPCLLRTQFMLPIAGLVTTLASSCSGSLLVSVCKRTNPAYLYQHRLVGGCFSSSWNWHGSLSFEPMAPGPYQSISHSSTPLAGRNPSDIMAMRRAPTHTHTAHILADLSQHYKITQAGSHCTNESKCS